MTQTQPVSGLLLPADADQPVRHIQVHPDSIRDVTQLIGSQGLEFILTPVRDVIMVAGREALLGDRRANALASILYSGPIMGDVLLLGFDAPALVSLSEQAQAELSELFDIDPGRSALDVAKAMAAETAGGTS